MKIKGKFERGEKGSPSLTLPHSASLDDAFVRSPIELIISLLSAGLVVFSLRIGIYLPHSSVERVRLNESG